jgi:methylthioribulose-1-phosphate dehydratase
LTLAITASAVPKGAIGVDDVVVIDPLGRIVGKFGRGRNLAATGGRGRNLAATGGRGRNLAATGDRRPSGEALLHVTVARARGAGAVLHTHSIWSTILSEVHAPHEGLTLTGYEMLKGLEGVKTHEHAEWVPILENDQNMERLGGVVEATLKRFPAAHAFMLRQHGLYTWGDDLAQARRHVEILEFLLEASGRTRTIVEPDSGGSHGTDQNPRRAANRS